MLTEQHAVALVVKRRDRQMLPVCPAQDAGCGRARLGSRPPDRRIRLAALPLPSRLRSLERLGSTLLAPAIRELVEGGAFQLSLFDERDLA